MKVLIDARVGWGSGIGRYVANVAPRVAQSMPGISFEMLVNSADHDTARAAIGSTIALRSTEAQPFSAGEQWALPRLSSRYDLTWFTNYWVPLGWRGRFVATVHDLMHLEPSVFPSSPFKRYASQATFAKIARDAAALLFVSRFSERSFRDRFTPRCFTTVTHLGVDHGAEWPLFDPNAPPIKRRQALLVAAPKAHKNFALALDAWIAAQPGPGWELVVVSPGKDLRSSIDLDWLVQDAGNVRLLRNLTNAELHCLYGETSILLMPSRYEGFGLPLLEGLQAGAICISSTAPALVEVAGNAHVAFADPRDQPGWTAAIEAACHAVDKKGAVLGALAAHNMRYAASFHWDRTAALTRDVLTEALRLPG